MFWRHYPDLWRWNPDVWGILASYFARLAKRAGFKGTFASYFARLAKRAGFKGTFASHSAHLAKCAGFRGTYASPFAHLAKCAGFKGTFASHFARLVKCARIKGIFASPFATLEQLDENCRQYLSIGSDQPEKVAGILELHKTIHDAVVSGYSRFTVLGRKAAMIRKGCGLIASCRRNNCRYLNNRACLV
ncbi:hypothetical protein R70723_04190 [Paenibacillus sp. FSL R7-0273]|nr:hypothetical protein R70723_04190 [Paenibacillus sp. FSL R7-0273]OMF85702.1 hypothetical protein BK144_27455 [Paenibacillus sp. FSL R7-0273]